MRALTYRQYEAHAFICEHIRTHGYAPSIREIGGALGITSTNAVADHLKALRSKGALAPTCGQRSRALAPITDEHGRPWGTGPGIPSNPADRGDWPASLTTMSGFMLRRVDVDLRSEPERERDRQHVETLRQEIAKLPTCDRARLLQEAAAP